VPTVVEFVDGLPKSNVGKVLRRTLKERESHVKSS
jgi:acyl-coenzyme A synthetase/AMP-(fatty) acid ligase